MLRIALVREDPRLKRDFSRLAASGRDLDEITRLAQLVVVGDLEIAMARSHRLPWRGLFGVPPRQLPSMLQQLEDLALTVERINESKLMSPVSLCLRVAGSLGPASSALEAGPMKALAARFAELPTLIRLYAESLREIPHAKRHPSKVFGLMRGGTLTNLLYETSQPDKGKRGLLPKRIPFETLARLLNATRELDSGIPALAKYLRTKPYTGEALRKFRARLRLQQALGGRNPWRNPDIS